MRALERLVNGHGLRTYNTGGRQFSTGGALQHGGVVTLGGKTQNLHVITHVEFTRLRGLDAHSPGLILNIHFVRIGEGDVASDFDAMPIIVAPLELQNVLDRLRRLGKRVGRGIVFNLDILQLWHQEPNIKQLPLLVKMRDANSPHPDTGIHQVISAVHRDVAGIDGHMLTARGDIQEIIARFRIAMDGVDDAMRFNKLAVLLSAGQRVKRGWFGFRQFLVAHNMNVMGHQHRGKFALAGFAVHFHGLAGLQRRVRDGGIQIKINPGRVVLDESICFVGYCLIEKGDHAAEVRGIVALGLFRWQATNLLGRVQFRERA